MLSALVKKLFPQSGESCVVRPNPAAIERLESRQMMSTVPTPLPLGPLSPVPPIYIVTKPKNPPVITPIPVTPTSPILQK